MSDDYHKFVFDETGKPVFQFEEMYQRCADPWHHGDAIQFQYDLILAEIERLDEIFNKWWRILDIGCGKGAFTERLWVWLKDATIDACDISPTAIKFARSHTNPFKEINYFSGDIRQIYKGLTHKYDLILFSQVIWYILPEFETVVKHLIEHSLKPRGYVLIHLAFPAIQLYGNEILSQPTGLIHLVNLPPNDWIELVSGGGLDANWKWKHDRNVIMTFRK